jgi:hypothetical protein
MAREISMLKTPAGSGNQQPSVLTVLGVSIPLVAFLLFRMLAVLGIMSPAVPNALQSHARALLGF